ncbi:MAG TPA: 30S ribosome-binding factor RbfA [Clostridiales bacterium]|nr:30S ribosome-binding factor RbfA [Clostridiales bacterium]HCU56368.1 30S ribosome-binding factor RbfA [Clostridiales bacterium]
MNIERINSELLKQLSMIFRYELNDPRIHGMLTVMEVKTSDDLSHARVYVSYYGDKTLEQETFEALQNCTGHMRNLLKKRVKMRIVPYLRIIPDGSLDNAMQLTELIENAMDKTHATEKNYMGEENGDN